MMLTRNDTQVTALPASAVTLDLKPESEEINALYKQLDDIFGTPKQTLSDAEQKQLDALNAKIDAIFAVDEEGRLQELTEAQMTELDNLNKQVDEVLGVVSYDNLSEEQQKKVDAIYAQLEELWADEFDIMPIAPISEEAQALYDDLDNIFGTTKQSLTETEQKQVDELNNKIEAILSAENDGELTELTEEQYTELAGLQGQIDQIYGVVSYDNLSEDQQKKVDKIYAQLDKLMAEQNGFVEVDNEETQALHARLDEIIGTPKKELTEEEQKQVDELNEKAESILSPDDTEEMPVLTDNQQQELNDLYKQIDKIYGITAYEDLTEEQQKEVDGIYAQLDKLSVGDLIIEDLGGIASILPAFDEKAQALFDELDGIFGKPKETLSEAEETQIETLNSKIDALFTESANGEATELTKSQEKELTDLYKQIDKVYGVKTYDDLTTAQQQRVDEIYKKLESDAGNLVFEQPVPDMVDNEAQISLIADANDRFDFSNLPAIEQLDTENNWVDFGMFEVASTMDVQPLADMQNLELTGLADFDFDFAGF